VARCVEKSDAEQIARRERWAVGYFNDARHLVSGNDDLARRTLDRGRRDENGQQCRQAAAHVQIRVALISAKPSEVLNRHRLHEGPARLQVLNIQIVVISSGSAVGGPLIRME
jgi:hypothetical protein